MVITGVRISSKACTSLAEGSVLKSWPCAAYDSSGANTMPSNTTHCTTFIHVTSILPAEPVEHEPEHQMVGVSAVEEQQARRAELASRRDSADYASHVQWEERESISRAWCMILTKSVDCS